MRALVIDDSRALRKILAKTLISAGFDVVEAGHGKEALDLLADIGKVELALVDWNMPEMNGFEFVQAVRSDCTYDSMRLVMVTTETEMAHMTQALEAGADEYIMKPFTPEVLREKLALLGFRL